MTFRANQGKRGCQEKNCGFLIRLLNDERGNTVAMVAAAVLPLAAMVGSGIDMSRNYLVKSRLQLACDAGALGGRRAMSVNNWGPTSENAAKSFFNTNFQKDSYGTENLSVTYTANTDGTVSGTASVDVPVSLMKLFGFTKTAVKVDCAAKMKVPNTDIMFVLDTTGSMGTTNPGDSSNRLTGLKSAVRTFYNALEASKGTGTRVRYGFVPYSSTVNVGHLLQQDWVVESWDYQSRTPRFKGTYFSSTETAGWYQVSGTRTSSRLNNRTSCPADTHTFTENVATASSTEADGTIIDVETKTRVWTGFDYSNCVSTGSGRFRVDRVAYNSYGEEYVTTVTKTPRFDWTYGKVRYDVSGVNGNGGGGVVPSSITVPIGNMDSTERPTQVSYDWDGCIEERDTIKVATASSVPVGAHDLNIDLVPYNDATRWRPFIPGLVYGRSVNASYNPLSTSGSWTQAAVNTSANYYHVIRAIDSDKAACPARSQKLAEIDSQADLDDYLATLVADGHTYHDIGMVWGARLISPKGLFASENETAPNGGEISRHLIFMTDGETAPSSFAYSAYGLEPLDQRRLNTYSQGDTGANVEARFTHVCNGVKNKNITVWVVAFGTSLTPLLSNCASKGRAYHASNTAQLNAAFATIATEIAQLRLTQ